MSSIVEKWQVMWYIVNMPVYNAGISPKEKVFIAEYVKTQNATEAAERAYDVANRRVARTLGAENMAKLRIKTEIMAQLEAVGVKLPEIFSIHARNARQEQNLSVSQTAVKDFYNLLGLVGQGEEKNTINESFVQLNLTLVEGSNKNLTHSQDNSNKPIFVDMENPETLEK